MTPQGFAEKSRLSLEYLTYSFTFFRQAKSDCLVAFETARERGITRVALAGVWISLKSPTICARESAVEIVAIVDVQNNLSRFVGFPIARGYDEVAGSFDGVIVTDLRTTSATVKAAIARFGTDRVVVPMLLQKAQQERGGPVNIFPASRWYVVQTRPRAEGKAVANLARQGFATYLPRYLKKRRHARRVETVLVPLFPRYLFVAVDMATQRWRSISSTFGVTQLVCNGDDPAPIADDIIDDFAAVKTNMEWFVFPRGLALRPATGFVSLDGAFADCIGLFEGMKETERVSVLLDLLGRKVRVLLDADSSCCRLTAA